MFDRLVVDRTPPGPELAQALLEVDRSRLDRDDLMVWAAASQRLEAHVEACRYEALALFADASPVEEPLMPGMRGVDRPTRPGGEGTPEISEFADTDLATELGCTTGRAHGLIGDGLDLRHRMPLLFAELRSGRVSGFKVRKVLAEAHWLSFFAARLLDARVAAVAGKVGPKRLAQMVEQVVVQVDPQAVADRAEAAKRDRRVDVFTARDGQRHIRADVDAVDGLAFDAAVDRVADILGDLGDLATKDVRRATAIGWLANPPATLALTEHHRAWMRGQAPAAWAVTIVPDTAQTPEPADYGGLSAADYAAAAAAAAAGTDADGFAHADSDGYEPVTHPHLRPGLWPTDVPTPADHIGKDLWPSATVVVHMSHQSWQTGTGSVEVSGHGPITADQAFDRLRHHRIVIKPVIDLNDDIVLSTDAADFSGHRRCSSHIAGIRSRTPMPSPVPTPATRPLARGTATTSTTPSPRARADPLPWATAHRCGGVCTGTRPMPRAGRCDNPCQASWSGRTRGDASTSVIDAATPTTWGSHLPSPTSPAEKSWPTDPDRSRARAPSPTAASR